MYTCLLFPDLITVLCDLACLLPYLALFIPFELLEEYLASPQLVHKSKLHCNSHAVANMRKLTTANARTI